MKKSSKSKSIKSPADFAEAFEATKQTGPIGGVVDGGLGETAYKRTQIAGIETVPAMRKENQKELRTLLSRQNKLQKAGSRLVKYYTNAHKKIDRNRDYTVKESNLVIKLAEKAHKKDIAFLVKERDRNFKNHNNEVAAVTDRIATLKGRLGL